MLLCVVGYARLDFITYPTLQISGNAAAALSMASRPTWVYRALICSEVMTDQLLNDRLRDSSVFEQADSGMTQ
jgi:hypothetical protein